MMEMKATLEKLNRALHILNNGKYPPFRNQLNLAWDDVSKSTKAFYTKLSSEIIDLVLNYNVPGQVDKVFSSVVYKRKTDETQSMLQLDVMTEALIKAYLYPNNHQIRLQILSLFAHKFTKQKTHDFNSWLNVQKLMLPESMKILKNQAKCSTLQEYMRMCLSQPQLMHFVESISSPMYYQAVGYGSITLQLSSGLEMTIPKVMRNIITSNVILHALRIRVLNHSVDQYYLTS
ncbi:unnamed protein product [Mytilus coruscus]|uniref:Uncharacterized protein n=1 Tax=Mytilus coruscus TaxID=42192 RepID=A0A6J8EG44_MYTCO|nr:unnamed protein product [Mytilus coruscus]